MATRREDTIETLHSGSTEVGATTDDLSEDATDSLEDEADIGPEDVTADSVPDSTAGESEKKGIPIRDMRYYDIMMLGLTGQGKSTTAAKLLIANPTGIDYETEYDSDTAEPIVDDSKGQVSKQDLSMWLISDDQERIEQAKLQVKNLIFHRLLSDPHKRVNEAFAQAYDREKNAEERTLSCELLSNETSKVRVLDVPGFFGKVNDPNRDSHDINVITRDTHLGTTRNILRIQAAMAMRFKRILYFLPKRGTLEFNDAALQQELQLMCYYFGRSIFETMVLVATLGPCSYEMFPDDAPVQMPARQLYRSRAVFQEALTSFLPKNTPNPPIIFISLRETCESILDKVKRAEVVRDDGLQLQLSSSVCARCSMTIGEKDGRRVACTSENKWSESILYEHSHCHPLLVPKYPPTRRYKLAYAVTSFMLNDEEWPDFSEEQCHKCGKEPGTPGCLPVGTKYNARKISRTVDHTSVVEGKFPYDHRSLLQDEPEPVQGRPVQDDTHAETRSTSSQTSRDSQKYGGNDGACFDERGVFSDTSVYVRKKKVDADIEPRSRRSLRSFFSKRSTLKKDQGEETVNEKVQASSESTGGGTSPELASSDEKEVP